jgi:two-component system CheB/CheR fusion protein
MPSNKKAKSEPEKTRKIKTVSAKKTKKRRVKKTSNKSAADSFPIVGIGASAGGLEAFTDFLKHLPRDTGMAFVFIQHLAAGQESLLTDILARSTPMNCSQGQERYAGYPQYSLRYST